MKKKRIFAVLSTWTLIIQCHATTGIQVKDSVVTTKSDSIKKERVLTGAQVTARRTGTSRIEGVQAGTNISRDELFKAACCNLGESFVTNPSVDVSYNDAATGARQIKLLGLSGIYVQMLAENIPDFRGAAIPYALGYVPGPWMKSIQVSKGAASVKNGYESITGQINVEYKKPEDEQGAEVNLYGNSMGRIEANADANLHIKDELSTELLLHYENDLAGHDSNGDGFMDKPKAEQYNVQNRWFYKQNKYIFHGGLTATIENRHSGQMHDNNDSHFGKYTISLNTNRYTAYAKNAFVLNPENGTNIALMASASLHKLDASYGYKIYNVNEKNLYASLMFERDYGKIHNISLGLSLNHDYLGQDVRLANDFQIPATPSNEKETTPGVYVQYTLNLNERFTAMAGLRADHSSLFGTFVTPRFHLKYAPGNIFSMRASIGKGYRTVHALAENNYLLASGRQLVVEDLPQEKAWNYGLSAALNIPLMGHILKMNVEYFYTRFSNQAVVDYDSDKNFIRISNLDGKSYSHTFQVDASYPLLKGLNVTAAWRLNDVKTTYNGTLCEKPLTSRYKGLLTVTYKTPLGIWQADATLQINGGGRMPEPYELSDGSPSWQKRFSPYAQLNAQITRWFRHWAIYLGGENLTDFKQKNPILGATNPWGTDFEPTLVWGPVEGAMVYAGVRINIGRNSF